ncbi:MAG: AcrB/AcrD/AcrF family protein, partial [Planctomycetes bacterium]|nr:AcrB/AcrD/AcrF family protein [Planctomycetota bacterium]
MNNLKSEKGLLSWFAANHVAANLLMALIIVGGLLTLFRIKLEVFPELSVDTITITVPYRGASPDDVENGVCIRVEEAIAAVDGIKRMTSTASEGTGITAVEVEEYADTKEVLDDIKAEIDTITTFPQETEKPIITELLTRNKVITLVIHGDVSERTLKELSEHIRDDLTVMPNISQVTISGLRPYEISIEVSEKNLRRYGISFDDIIAAVRDSSLDIPAGSVKTTGGDILLRTKGQKYYGPEFEEIIIISGKDGTEVRLSDIATVHDSFEDIDLYSRFDGKRAALVSVFRVGEQDALDVANTVKKYVDNKQAYLPEGVSMSLWEDDSKILKSRINLLKRNGCLGLILVFLCLSVFLDLRLAFWTTMGIPISFMGAFWLMPLFGVSINMISLFALIMALGIVVDDAIVVGENIFEYRRSGLSGAEAAIKGVKEMTIPVVLAVLTTMFAFLPLAYTSGIMGKILRVLPIVVISVLATSLVEALLILPAHLSTSRMREPRTAFGHFINKIHIWTESRLESFVNGSFARVVVFAIKWRYITLSIAIAVFLITLGFITGGYIKFVFFDTVEADNMVASLTMPQGTPVEQTSRVVAQLEEAVEQVRREFDAHRKGKISIINHVSATIGGQPTLGDHGPDSVNISSPAQAHLGEVNVELLDGEKRDVSSVELKNRWREIVGEIPGISSLSFISEIFSAGDDINVELSHENF